MRCLMVGSSLIALLVDNAAALNIVLPGGTGSIGSRLSAKLMDHTVTILTRNAFLAAAPNRVTEQFGWVGSSFLRKNPHVNLRDWDGGDLLDIVGQDWIGWQEEALLDADVVVHFVGGFTEQRTMACERLVRESMRVNKDALQITVNPLDEEIGVISVGAVTQKKERIRACEEMVKMNCVHSMCLRIECYREDEGCEQIKSTIVDWAKRQGNK